MRRLLLVGVIAGFACVKASQKGTQEWTNEQYSKALLQTNQEAMRTYAVQDTLPPNAPDALKDRLKGLHLIKQCPVKNNAEKTSYTTLVLIAGGLNDSVYGVQVTTVKQDVDWKVESAAFAVDAQGVPKRYLRNCGEDLSVEKKPIKGL
jgi:hypothetical protein